MNTQTTLTSFGEQRGTLTSKMWVHLNDLLELASNEHTIASRAFRDERTGENLKKLQDATELLSQVIDLCEANGIEVN